MIGKGNILKVIASAALWLTVGSATADAAPLAQSNFTSSTEGWTIYSDGTALTHHASGGSAGGYISIQDTLQGGAFGFSAPGNFLGNKSEAYGGTLHFSLSQSGQGNQVDFDDVTLIGAGLTLVIDAGANPAFFEDWTAYEVSLLAGAGWKVNSLAGAAATESQLQQVLGSLDNLIIRGEFQGGSWGRHADTGRLDSVSLESGPASSTELSSSVPEPSSLLLTALGAIFCVWMGVRRGTLTSRS